MAISFFPQEISDRNLSHFLFWSQFYLFCDQVKLQHQLPFSFPLQVEASVTLEFGLAMATYFKRTRKHEEDS